MKKLALGIDIGGTNTKFGFVDAEGNTYAEKSFETNDDRSFDDFINQLNDEIISAKKDVDFQFELIGTPGQQ